MSTADPPMPPERVRFGPGEVPVTEEWYERQRRQAQAYYDAMQRDVTSGHVWPVRECAGDCGRLVNGPMDKCRLCRARKSYRR